MNIHKPTQKPTVADIVLLDSRLVVLPDTPAEKSEGGIYYPDETKGKEKRCYGTVLAMGPGRRLEDGTLQDLAPITIGCRVVYGSYAGVDLTVDGKGYKVIQRDDVFGILPEGLQTEPIRY